MNYVLWRKELTNAYKFIMDIWDAEIFLENWVYVGGGGVKTWVYEFVVMLVWYFV